MIRQRFIGLLGAAWLWTVLLTTGCPLLLDDNFSTVSPEEAAGVSGGNASGSLHFGAGNSISADASDEGRAGIAGSEGHGSREDDLNSDGSSGGGSSSGAPGGGAASSSGGASTGGGSSSGAPSGGGTSSSGGASAGGGSSSGAPSGGGTSSSGGESGAGGSSSDTPSDPASCAAGAVVGANGHCYVIRTTSSSWVSARSDCRNLGDGWDLATIRGNRDAAFLSRILTTEAWIGANDASGTGVWRWVSDGAQFWQGGSSGNPLNGAYVNWNSGEPNGDGARCLRIVPSALWAAVDCGSGSPAVCEGPAD